MLIETLNVWKFLIVSSQSLIESISPEPTGTGEDKNKLFMQRYDTEGVTYVSIKKFSDSWKTNEIYICTKE